MLEVKNISYSIRNKKLLNNISFSIKRGFISGILGANGAGKSTLFKIIIGEYLANSGQLIFASKPFSNYPRHSLAQKIAMVAQSETANPELSVLEYILLGRLAYRATVYIEEDYAKVLNTMQQLEIDYLREQKYALLSGGERNRVQLARALVQLNSDSGYDGYLLLDEFDANMDIYHQQLSMKLLSRLVKSHNLGVLIIGHDLNCALNYFDYCILLKNGSLIEAGTPLEILTPENIRNIFKIDTRIIKQGNSVILSYW